MYKTILVAKDVESGRQVVDGLEKMGIPITAAFWFYFEEEQRWRLVIVSPDVGSRGRKEIYGLTVLLLTGREAPTEMTPDQVMFITPDRLLYKQVKQGTGLAITRGPVRDAVVEDAYIYRI